MKNKRLSKLIAVTAIITTVIGVNFATSVKAATIPSGTIEKSSLNNYATTTRLWGKDRFDTAIEVSNEFTKTNKELNLENWDLAYPDTAKQKVNTVILANAFDYPDALAAAPLTHLYNAPILLTEKDKLNSKTEAQLKKLGIKKVVMVGGDGVISNNVDKKLKSMGISTERIGGKDRYQTSLAIAKKVASSHDIDAIHVVSGHNFSDALTVAPVAATWLQPMILVPQGENKKISDVEGLEEFISLWEEKCPKVNKYGNDFTKYTYGNKYSVSDNILNRLKDIDRIGYTDSKLLNNLLIIDDKLFRGEVSANNVIFASGKDFPDALTGSALAGKLGAIIMYEGTVGENVKKLNDKIHFDVNEYLNNLSSKFKNNVFKVYYLGGETIVPKGAEKKLNGKL
ncbi:cell wall-binding repeat-containing protein [Clostridium faecium]|uniref:Cell wall-binding repeat-containing protein n=1 Tax=Clostridium faecium TaxID=2762223 RepID=A0ABR8YP95_9CLOT|nr:cell wall-binding repeat-containing protein [Clostridium faecium]MBD8045851.1 cell wall-binding repeat-containing protein [Clostridium faecium]